MYESAFGGELAVKQKKLQTFGFLFTIVIGTLLHFTYEWSGENALVGAFSAVNESVWEHLKLIVVPMLLFGVAEYFIYGRKKENFIAVRFISILLGMAVIITVFYTYSGILGRDYLVADILLFVLAVYIAYRFSNRMLQTNRLSSKPAKGLALAGILVLLVCFTAFTFAPPHIGIFRDSTSGGYGATLK